MVAECHLPVWCPGHLSLFPPPNTPLSPKAIRSDNNPPSSSSWYEQEPHQHHAYVSQSNINSEVQENQHITLSLCPHRSSTKTSSIFKSSPKQVQKMDLVARFLPSYNLPLSSPSSPILPVSTKHEHSN